LIRKNRRNSWTRRKERRRRGEGDKEKAQDFRVKRINKFNPIVLKNSKEGI
jgi:hypothetical protein